VILWPWKRRDDPEEERERLRAALEAAREADDLDAALPLAERLLALSSPAPLRLAAGEVLVAARRAEQAREVLEGIDPADLEGEDAEVREECLAECLLELGEPAEALRILEALPPETLAAEPRPHWLIGLCHDHLGAPKRADRAFRSAERIAPDEYPRPIPISPDEAAALARRVIAELPEAVRALIPQVPVVIDDLPPLATIRETRGGISHDTLGLYTGVSLADRGSFDPSGPPTMIQIFRRNLERFARDRAELEEEIRITLLHELGHHLGLDEDDVDRLGLA